MEKRLHLPVAPTWLRFSLIGWIIVLQAGTLLLALWTGRYLIDDSIQYMSLAENLIRSGAFSQSYVEPLTPDLQRTPGYPVLLGLCGNVPELVLVVQHLMLLVIAWILRRIGREMGSRAGGWWLAVLFLSMPYPALMASQVLSEVPFMLLLVLAMGYWLRAWRNGSWQDMLAAGLAFGLACLLRPVAWPLVVPAILALLWRLLRQRHLRPVLAFVLGTMVVTGPWMARNASHGGGWSLSNMGGMGLLHGRTGGLLAYQSAAGNDEITLYMYGDSLAAAEYGLTTLRNYHDARRNHETESYRSGMLGLTLRLYAEHPLDAIGFQAHTVWQMAAGTGYGWALRLTESRGLALPLAAVQLLLNILMVGLLLLALFRIRKGTSLQWTLLVAVFVLTAVSGAAWADGRYRMVMDPLILILGLDALRQFMEKRIPAVGNA